MAFRVTGTLTIDSSKRSIIWDNGKLLGDEKLVKFFIDQAMKFEGTQVALPTSSGHTTNHLSHGESMLVIFKQYFESGWIVEGETGFVEAVPGHVVS